MAAPAQFLNLPQLMVVLTPFWRLTPAQQVDEPIDNLQTCWRVPRTLTRRATETDDRGACKPPNAKIN